MRSWEGGTGEWRTEWLFYVSCQSSHNLKVENCGEWWLDRREALLVRQISDCGYIAMQWFFLSFPKLYSKYKRNQVLIAPQVTENFCYTSKCAWPNVFSKMFNETMCNWLYTKISLLPVTPTPSLTASFVAAYQELFLFKFHVLFVQHLGHSILDYV